MNENQKRARRNLKNDIIDLVFAGYGEEQILDLVKRYYKSGVKVWKANTQWFKDLIRERG